MCNPPVYVCISGMTDLCHQAHLHDKFSMNAKAGICKLSASGFHPVYAALVWPIQGVLLCVHLI